MKIKVLIFALLVNFAYGDIDCGVHKECIAKEQCGTAQENVNKDGKGLLEPRLTNYVQCGENKVCCPMKSETEENSEFAGIFKIPKCGQKGSYANLMQYASTTNNYNWLDVRIMNDDKEDPEIYHGAFPWMILVLKKNPIGVFQRNFSGSLIKENVVLTTAHNLKDSVAENLMVRAGMWDIEIEDENMWSEDKKVKLIVKHENFIKETLANDVSLFFLDGPFVLNSHINVICLPQQDQNFNGRICTVTGWGKKVFGSSFEEKPILKKVDLTIVPFEECNQSLKKLLKNSFNLDESFTCAGGELNKDACTGDGGSGLYCKSADQYEQYYLAGIVSWGIGCGKANVPGVYVDVAKFVDWIEEQVQENEIIDP